LRNGTLYGPDTWYSADGSMAQAARNGNLLGGSDVTSFVHVDAAASAGAAAIGWKSAVVNVVDDEPAAASIWVPVFCAAVGAESPLPGVEPAHDWARGALNARARAMGWTPRFGSWRQGFAEGLSLA
jgi:nucleoside-diphosphate-sugar epimerase